MGIKTLKKNSLISLVTKSEVPQPDLHTKQMCHERIVQTTQAEQMALLWWCHRGMWDGPLHSRCEEVPKFSENQV